MGNKTVLKIWIVLTIATLGICMLVYATVQQSLRQGANDPQIQLAEDVKSLLDNGKLATDFNGYDKTDIGKSLSTFILIYDTEGKAVAGTGLLNNSLPTLPTGVLQSAKNLGEDRVTWQPESGVREALVVVPYSKGYVAVGRSLREVEKREQKTFLISVLAWITISIISLIVLIILEKIII